jgi:proline iminopeptidase
VDRSRAPRVVSREIAQAWLDTDLVVIENSCHTGSPAMGTAFLDAIAKRGPMQSHS